MSKEITTDETLVLCKKLNKFEKTFMNLSDDVTKLIKTIEAQNEVIGQINLRYEFILNWILDQSEK